MEARQIEGPFEADLSRVWSLPEPTVTITGPSRKIELPLGLWEHLGPEVQRSITEWATASVPLTRDVFIPDPEGGRGANKSDRRGS